MVYVDNFNAKYGRMTMCHMIADSQEELLAMADKIGVNRKWIQHKGTPKEHFDICLSNKKKALRFGAKEISSRELTRMIITRKQKSNYLLVEGRGTGKTAALEIFKERYGDILYKVVETNYQFPKDNKDYLLNLHERIKELMEITTDLDHYLETGQIDDSELIELRVGAFRLTETLTIRAASYLSDFGMEQEQIRLFCG